MKYRLIKKIHVSGSVFWVVQKKFLWWWEYVDSSGDETKARDILTKLRSGVPEERRIVVE